MYNGIINVYKEAGYTSHDVCARLRGIFGQKKIGHTGTLDPAAAGVLPVCLGSGTKLVDMITDKSKIYKAKVLLGTSTDTEDITGTITNITDEGKVMALTGRDIEEILRKYIGGYNQIPPMYSALKKDGKRLYELAREGVEIERQPRWVDIFSITLDKLELPYFEMTVHCGKGTYIRSLCRDIGESLGCGACMAGLVRTKVGSFSIEEAYTLEKLQNYKDTGSLDEIVIPVDEMFCNLPRLDVPDRCKKLVINGNRMPKDAFGNTGFSGEVRVYFQGTFYGIYTYDKEEQYIMPVKMFLSGGTD